MKWDVFLACERRRISGCRLSPPKNTVCELEQENDFRDVKILSQSELVSENLRTTTRVTCESIARLHGGKQVRTTDTSEGFLDQGLGP